MFALIWTAFIVAAVWLLLVRPQRKRMADHQTLMASLQPGDEVITAGGIHGRIESVGDDELRVEIAPATVIRLARRAVARNLSQEHRRAESDAASADDDS